MKRRSAGAEREALRRLIEGCVAARPGEAWTPAALNHARNVATGLLFRILAVFAEEETRAEPSVWRQRLAAVVDSDAKGIAGASVLAASPLAPLLVHSAEAGIGARAFLLAADALSREDGPLGVREWTDFRGFTPRDYGCRYESLLALRPTLLPDDAGGWRIAWAEDDRGRKASGSYYTPERITRHIVESALAPLLKEAKGEAPPHERERMAALSAPAMSEASAWARGGGVNFSDSARRAARRGAVGGGGWLCLLDPAMGCGYFLLAAGETLLAYRSAAAKQWDDEAMRAARRRIARESLFGVDRDPVAVELARLAVTAWAEGRPVAVPDPALERNLRCGNALIGAVDAASGQATEGFQWREAFPEVFAEGGGFNAVVGNPPYDNSRGGLTHNPELAEVARYARAHPDEYVICGAVDLYRLFLQRGLAVCRVGGVVSMIVPRTLLGDRDALSERRMLTQNAAVLRVDDFPYDDAARRVFASASAAVCIVTAQKGGRAASFPLYRWADGRMVGEPERRVGEPGMLERLQPGGLPFVGLTGAERDALERLSRLPWLCPLSELADGAIGEVNSGTHKRFMMETPTGTRLLRGADVTPYALRTLGMQRRWLDRDGFLATLSPAVRDALPWRERRVVKQAVKNVACRKRLVAALSEPGQFLADSTDAFTMRPPYDPRYLLALLNSDTALEWLFRLVSTNNNVNLYQVRHLPAPRVRFGTPPPERACAVAEGWRLLEAVWRAPDAGNRAAWAAWWATWRLTEDAFAVTDVAHDLVARMAAEMETLARRLQEPEIILEDAEAVHARREVVRGALDAVVASLYESQAPPPGYSTNFLKFNRLARPGDATAARNTAARGR